MRILIASLVLLSIISCKKEKKENGLLLSNSSWNLYFKHNSTFNFYAQSHLYFDSDKKVTNFRNADTLHGEWESKGNNLSIIFNNGDKYNGNAITPDSLSGTLIASGNNGVWYAIRK